MSNGQHRNFTYRTVRPNRKMTSGSLRMSPAVAVTVGSALVASVVTALIGLIGAQPDQTVPPSGATAVGVPDSSTTSATPSTEPSTVSPAPPPPSSAPVTTTAARPSRTTTSSSNKPAPPPPPAPPTTTTSRDFFTQWSDNGTAFCQALHGWC